MESPVLLSLVSIIVFGVGAKWLAWLTRIPSILLLLVTGFLVGPVFGWINPRELFGELLLPFISLSVAIILFEGGLSLRMKKIREVGGVILKLVTVGAFVSGAATFFLLYYALGFGFTFSILESAILVITGPTVVIPMLQHLHIKEPTRSILRSEGVLIDPIGAVAAVIILEAILVQGATAAVETIAIGVIKTLVIGIGIGIGSACIVLFGFRRFWLAEAHHNPVVLMLVLGTFALSNLLQADSGLLTVTVMGFVLANQESTAVKHIVEFKENLRDILIAFLFITIAGIVDVEALQGVLGASLALLVFLILIVRPLSVVFSTIGSSLSWKEILFMSFLAPRGIVSASISSLFGLQLAAMNYSEAALLSPMTFVVIAGTVVFYGAVAPIMAKALGLSNIAEKGILIIGANLVARTLGEALHDEGFNVQLIDTNYWKVSRTKKVKIPVFHGNFLAYEAEHLEELEEMAMVFAMTESDDVNSLAAIHFSRYFDQSNIFQLLPATERIPENLMGRSLFGQRWPFDMLQKRIGDGWAIRKAVISADHTYKDWQAQFEQAAPIFFIRPNGLLVPVTVKMESSTRPIGGKILFLAASEDQ